VLLVLKVLLVPGLVAGATLAIRRWGPRIGGWLTGMPIVAGPTLFFLAMEQGDRFAAEAAGATLVALVGVAAFGLTYGWLALRASWPPSLLAGWAVFGALTPLLHAAGWRPLTGLVAVLASLGVAQQVLPPARGRPTAVRAPAWDLPLRMAGALAVVLTVTSLARRLGPAMSGALAPFPIALAVILAFSHAQQGAAMVVRLLRGFFPAMWAFATFCFVLAVATVPLGRYAAFALALVAQLAVQGATFWWLTRR
jgi:hypothetical protein